MAATSTIDDFCCRSLDEQRGRLSEALLYSILLSQTPPLRMLSAIASVASA
jgi:hypothetical protein